MKKIFLLFLLICYCTSSFAQNTTVSGPMKKVRTFLVSKTRHNQQSKINRKIISEHSDLINGHGYVDLGLSVKWATCNVGANNSSSYGNYYAWGENSTKSFYSENNYSWKYPNTLNNSIQGTANDVAFIKWGKDWRMPTESECKELIDKCNWKWTRIDGHKGYLVKGPNGKTIFLPAAGGFNDKQHYLIGGVGAYWTSSTGAGDGGCSMMFETNN